MANNKLKHETFFCSDFDSETHKTLKIFYFIWILSNIIISKMKLWKSNKSYALLVW